jgi:2-amino-4-hydroxy-6-hydroxymethyldihydropteridine diphosphokinase
MAIGMSRAQIGLGSNLGDPSAQIEAALTALERFGQIVARSGLYLTPPIGPPQPSYVNAAATLETSLLPEPLLAGLKGLEQELGRTVSPRWGPRFIDLDLLLYGDLQLQTPLLTVPHPELHRRGFVLVPLAEIAGAARHPVLGQTIAELAQTLSPREIAAIRRLDKRPASS